MLARKHLSYTIKAQVYLGLFLRERYTNGIFDTDFDGSMDEAQSLWAYM